MKKILILLLVLLSFKVQSQGLSSGYISFANYLDATMIHGPNNGGTKLYVATILDSIAWYVINHTGVSAFNIRNSSGVASGDFIQNWNHKQLLFDNVKKFEIRDNLGRDVIGIDTLAGFERSSIVLAGDTLVALGLDSFSGMIFIKSMMLGGERIAGFVNGNHGGFLSISNGMYFIQNNTQDYLVFFLGGKQIFISDSTTGISAVNGMAFYSGNGNPNTVITASVGSIYSDSSGTTGTTFWIKETGTATNTGWVVCNTGGLQDLSSVLLIGHTANNSILLTDGVNSSEINEGQEILTTTGGYSIISADSFFITDGSIKTTIDRQNGMKISSNLTPNYDNSVLNYHSLIMNESFFGSLKYNVEISPSQIKLLIIGGKQSTLTNESIYVSELTGDHLISTVETLTITPGTGSGTIGTPTLSIVGGDMGGYITLITSTVPTTSSIVATVTFSESYITAPNCIIIIPANNSSSLLSGVNNVFVNQSSITTTTFDITSGTTALTGSTTYKWYYFVKQ